MKFLLSVAAIIAVASALPAQRGVVSPVVARPAIVVDENNNPIAIGPDFINGVDDFVVVPGVGPISTPVFPTPVSPIVPAPVASSAGPLVQLIVNVNAPAAPAAPEPVQIVDMTPVVDPVQIVDIMPVVDPVQIVDVAPVVDPVQIVDVMPVVDPVQIVDVMPIVDPVQIVDVMPTPVVEPVQVIDVIPSPAVSLPDELN